MALTQIPLLQIPAQKLTIALGGQQCIIALRQRSSGLYLSLTVDDVPILSNALCVDRSQHYRQGFTGSLFFYDTTREQRDPYYTGLGTDYLLIYSDVKF